MQHDLATLFTAHHQATYSKMYDWLDCRKELCGDAKRVYAKIAQHGRKSGLFYPSQKTLAEELGLDERTIRRHVKTLKDLKLIEVQRNGKKLFNNYRFLPHPWFLEWINKNTKQPQERIPKRESDWSDSTSHYPSDRTDLAGHTESDRTNLSYSDRTDLAGPYNQISINQISNKSIAHPPNGVCATRSTASQVEEKKPANSKSSAKTHDDGCQCDQCKWFEYFWHLYPRKVSKKRAKKIFMREVRTEEKYNAVLDGLRRTFKHYDARLQAEGWRPDAKHPDTWLANECWNDQF
jgi:DNA-binding transcriptional ArsR family regulator